MVLSLCGATLTGSAFCLTFLHTLSEDMIRNFMFGVVISHEGTVRVIWYLQKSCA